MSIFEVIGGPITHKYLMGKTKHDLAYMYLDLLRATEREAKEAERYRWLRHDAAECKAEPSPAVVSVQGPANTVRGFLSGESLDAAIDAAMGAEGGGE